MPPLLCDRLHHRTTAEAQRQISNLLRQNRASCRKANSPVLGRAVSVQQTSQQCQSLSYRAAQIPLWDRLVGMPLSGKTQDAKFTHEYIDIGRAAQVPLSGVTLAVATHHLSTDRQQRLE